MTEVDIKEEHIKKSIDDLIMIAGGNADTIEGELIAQMEDSGSGLLLVEKHGSDWKSKIVNT